MAKDEGAIAIGRVKKKKWTNNDNLINIFK